MLIANVRLHPPAVLGILAAALSLTGLTCGGERDSSASNVARPSAILKGEARSCDRTIAADESIRSFLARLGAGRTGCLTAGTYEVGNLHNFRPAQQLVARSDPSGRRERVTLRGTLRLSQPGVELHDLFIVGVWNPQNDKVVSINRCDGCVLDHLDITTSPAYEDFQGILNNAPTKRLSITNNRIHHIGNDGGYDHGIYCRAPMTDGLIEGNWLYRNAAYGIILYTDCDGVDFRYNVVANNGVLENCGEDQPHGTRCRRTEVNGLGVALSGQPDLGLGATDAALVRNSIISSSARDGKALVHCYQPGTGNVVRQLSLEWSWSDRWPSGSDCPSHVSVADLAPRVDPRFRAETRNDYRLRPGSPARTVMGAFADRVPGPRL